MSSETRGVKVAATREGVTIASANPDLGEVGEELEAEFNGDPITIGFNPEYVVELFSPDMTGDIAGSGEGESMRGGALGDGPGENAHRLVTSPWSVHQVDEDRPAHNPALRAEAAFP